MGDRVKVTIHSSYTEWVDPDYYDDPSPEAIRETFHNMAADVVEYGLRTRFGTFAVTAVEVTEEKQT